MSDRILFFVVTTGLAYAGAWLAARLNYRARVKQPPVMADGVVTLTYPRWWVWAGWALLLSGMGLIAVGYGKVPAGDVTGRVISVVVALIFGGAIGGALIENRGVRVHLSGGGIVADSPWKGVRELPWEQVDQIDFQVLGQWFRVWDQHGAVIRIPRQLVGIPQLEYYSRRHLPADRYKAATGAFAAYRNK